MRFAIRRLNVVARRGAAWRGAAQGKDEQKTREEGGAREAFVYEQILFIIILKWLNAYIKYKGGKVMRFDLHQYTIQRITHHTASQDSPFLSQNRETIIRGKTAAHARFTRSCTHTRIMRTQMLLCIRNP